MDFRRKFIETVRACANVTAQRSKRCGAGSGRKRSGEIKLAGERARLLVTAFGGLCEYKRISNRVFQNHRPELQHKMFFVNIG